jgi:tetratricopeptide (TPR) repeat protein
MPATVNLFGRAVELLPRDDATRLELLPELAAALVDSGEFAQAKAVAEEAISEARTRNVELVEWRARLVLLWVQVWTATGTSDVLAEAGRAAEALQRLGDELGLARAWHLIGLTRFWLGRGAPGIEAFERALAHARAAGARRDESEILTWLLVATWFGPPPAEEGIRRCQEILEQPPDRRCEAFALTELGAFLGTQGRFDEGRGLLERGRTMLADLGLRIAAAGASQERFDLEMLADRPAEAERELREACDTLEEIGEKGFLSTRLGCLAEALYAQGRFEGAERVSLLAEDMASDPNDLDAQFRWRAVRAKALARRGELAAAEKLAIEAAGIVEKTDWPNIRAGVQLDLADVLELAGRDAEAIPVVEEALRLYEEKQNRVGASKARSRLAALRQQPVPDPAPH